MPEHGDTATKLVQEFAALNTATERAHQAIADMRAERRLQRQVRGVRADRPWPRRRSGAPVNGRDAHRREAQGPDMTPWQERRVAHAALRQVVIICAAEGKWTTACDDLWRVAVDCTKPRRRWWFW